MKKKYNDILKSIFQSRIEDIASLTREEKESLDNQKEIVYIEDYIKDLTDEQKKQAGDYLDDVMLEVYNESASLNEKYYRYGFSDGVNALLTSLNMKEEVERRFKDAK